MGTGRAVGGQGVVCPREGTPDFFTALGAFRATIGQQIALPAAHYDIDVEGDLVAILPILEDGED